MNFNDLTPINNKVKGGLTNTGKIEIKSGGLTSARDIFNINIVKSDEPGKKESLTDYIQIGQECDNCGEMSTHAYHPKKKTITCLKCRVVRYIK